jgi:hypothetical protein
MDLKELEKWLETDEGIKWEAELKAPLLHKRDELLSALKEANGKLAELDQRSAATEKSLSDERAATTAVLVDRELASLLKNANVFETVIPGVVQALKETYGIRVKADGSLRIPHGITQGENGTEKETSLTDIVSMWCKTPEAQKVILNTNTGGGAIGGTRRGAPPPSTSLHKLSGQTLASMTDTEFRNARNDALNSAKENI